MIKNYKAPFSFLQALSASSLLRPVFSFCAGYACPYTFMLSLFSLNCVVTLGDLGTEKKMQQNV